MARLKPTVDTLKLLFARSGNQCAFPGCRHQLFNKDNELIAQICHIEAAEKGGQRYNIDSTDEERRNYDNLIILCYAHHIETNKIDKYPVEKLKKIKYEHEKLFEKNNFKIDESELFKICDEMDNYWNKIEKINKIEHKYLDSELAIEVNGNDNFADVINGTNEIINDLELFLNTLYDSDKKLINDLSKLLKEQEIDVNIFERSASYEWNFVKRNWEFHNLGTPNLLKQLRIKIVHIEVKYLEEYLKTNSSDLNAHNRFKIAKESLEKYAGESIYYD